MSTFPKSTVGLVSLFLFVAWLVFMLKIPQVENFLYGINTAISMTFENINEAGEGVISPDEGLFGFGVISSFFSLIWNVLLVPILFVIQILITFAVFISVLTMLPFEFSGILVALLSVGLVLSLLKFVIPE